MIPTILTASAWAFTSCCGLTAVSGYVAVGRATDGWRWREGLWTAPLVFTSAAAAALAWLGAVPPVFGALFAWFAAAPVAVFEAQAWLEAARRHGRLRAARSCLFNLLGRLKVALWNAREDLRDLTGRLHLRRGALPEPGGRIAPPPVPMAAPPPQAQPVRPVPPARPVRPAAPAVPAPDAGYLPSAAMTPGWAGLCSEIDGFEADTDEEVLGFIAAQLAGHAAHAWSVRDLADRMLHGTGLDPAFAQGVAEYADENADMTGAVTMLDRQFHAIYDTLRAWADEHPMGMPHRAREFLQGGEPPLPDAGDDGVAA